MVRLLFLTAASAALFTAAPAAASSLSVRVTYRGLNLATPEGVKVFDRRIARAITAVCPTTADLRNLALAGWERNCRRVAMTSVQAQRDKVITASRTRAGAEVAAR